MPLIAKISTFIHLRGTAILTRRLFRSCTAALLLLSGSTAAFAADKQDEQPPWYEVEVIIFTNNEQLGLKTETWPDAVSDKPNDNVINLRLPDDPSVLEEKAKLEAALPKPQLTPVATGKPGKPAPPPAPAPEPPKPVEVPYVMLDKSTFQLTTIDHRLRRSGKYHVLLHLCWRQPTLPPDKSVPVYIYQGMEDEPAQAMPVSNTSTAGQTMPATSMYPGMSQGTDQAMGPMGPTTYPMLSGTLRLSVSRYLHMDTDLHLRMPLMVQEQVPLASSAVSDANTSAGSFFSGNTSTEPQTEMQDHEVLTDFPLRESRRLRSTEIHYLDNPVYGMIFTVRPYEINKDK